MGLRGDAAIVGIVEEKSERKFTGTPSFSIEQWADLAARALDDAGLSHKDVNGIVCAHDMRESSHFVPATVAEYCGYHVNFAEKMDLGGASAVGMVWRAAAAIELGICDVVVGVNPARPAPDNPHPVPVDPRVYWGASSNAWGSPQAEFDIPFGNVAQNCGYAMIAQRYGYQFGYDERAMAKIVVDQRNSAAVNPNAVFYGKPVTIDDVLASKLIADPLHMLEIVMPCFGGAGFVMTSRERASKSPHRPVFVIGFGEHLTHKTPTYMPSMVESPVGPAARMAFAMSGLSHADIDCVQLYDCYTITLLLSIEDSGFCGKGEGMAFVRDHDLSYKGDFPCNTHGGQLGFGQTGLAGGMSHVMEAVRQIRGHAGDRQLRRCDNAYVSGTGGVLSEQSSLILRGA